MEKIKIVLAKEHEAQSKQPEIHREVQDVQSFFNKTDFSFKQRTVNFVLLRGLYNHLERSMMIIGVFVNKTDRTMNGLETELSFQVKSQPNATFTDLILQLPPSFLGEIQPNEGFILHMKVLVEGLPTDKQVYEATELAGHVKNMKFASPIE